MHKALVGAFLDEYSGLSKNFNLRPKSNFTLTLTMPGLVWDLPFFIENIPNVKCYLADRRRSDVAADIFKRRYKQEHNYSYDKGMINTYLDCYYEYVKIISEIWPDVIIKDKNLS